MNFFYSFVMEQVKENNKATSIIYVARMDVCSSSEQKQSLFRHGLVTEVSSCERRDKLQ